ncbi:MAG TPA: hypothetical protein VE988_22985 [Gemmataceae bacterium]|nr:hypothetical protein [Gemmataceae bacterium]
MIKTTALVCAALLTFTASAFGMHKAGWFNGKPPRGSETRQVHNDPLQSDDAIRFRQNHNANWRTVMTVR